MCAPRMTLFDTVCKRGKVLSKSQPLKHKLAFMCRFRELLCFANFLELRSNEVSPHIANVQGSETPRDLSFLPFADGRGEPRARVPIEGS